MNKHFGQKDYSRTEVDGHFIETWLHNNVQMGCFEPVKMVDGVEVELSQIEWTEMLKVNHD